MRDNKEEKKRYYMISAVAKMYNIHPQTLRLYEREGLLKPSRSEGNTRLYTDEDLKRLEFILMLTREMGVNLAGVEIILNMRDKMERIQKQVNELVDFLREVISERSEELESRKRAIIKLSQLDIVKKEKMDE